MSLFEHPLSVTLRPLSAGSLVGGDERAVFAPCLVLFPSLIERSTAAPAGTEEGYTARG